MNKLLKHNNLNLSELFMNDSNIITNYIINNEYKNLFKLEFSKIQEYFNYCNEEECKILMNLFPGIDLNIKICQYYIDNNQFMFDSLLNKIVKSELSYNIENLDPDINPKNIKKLIDIGICNINNIFLKACRNLNLDFIKYIISSIDPSTILLGMKIIYHYPNDNCLYYNEYNNKEIQYIFSVNYITQFELKLLCNIMNIIYDYLKSRYIIKNLNYNDFGYCEHPEILNILDPDVFYDWRKHFYTSIKKKDFRNTEVLIDKKPIDITLNFNIIDKYKYQMPKLLYNYIYSSNNTNSNINNIDKWEFI